ncbi:MAG: ADOP family duplicated permease [Gemmatimonadales bacterium]
MSLPRWAAWILRRTVAADIEAEALADFEELFRERVERLGRARALGWLAANVAGFGLRVRWADWRDGRPGRRARLDLASDLRAATRGLARRPGMVTLAVLTLGIGIGATTAVFSAVRGVLLRPLPFNDADRLVAGRAVLGGSEQRVFSAPDFLDLERESTTLSGIATYSLQSATFSDDGRPTRVPLMKVSAGFLPLVGAPLLRGRLLTPEDDRAGAPKVVVVAEAFWTTRLGRADDVIGRTVALGEVPHTVVGVVGAGFDFFRTGAADPVAGWVPNAFPPWRLRVRNAFSYELVARLAEGIDPARASAETAAVLGRVHPELTASWIPLEEHLIGTARRPLSLVMGAVALLFGLTLANVVGLLHARLDERAEELAARSALGASRGRLALLLGLDAGIVTGLAGLVGLGVAALALRGIVAAGRLPRPVDVQIDTAALLWVLAVSGGSALLLSLAPLGRLGRTPLLERSREREPRRRDRARRAMATLQCALGFVVLVGAGLLGRALATLERADLGFDPRDAIAFRVSLPDRYDAEAKITGFFHSLVESLAREPGTIAAGAIDLLPFGGHGDVSGRVQRDDMASDEWIEGVSYRVVTPGFFGAIGAELLRGRDLAWTDRSGTEPVAVIGRLLAVQLFGQTDPVGRSVRIGGGDPLRIVGVVGDLRGEHPGRPAGPVLYRAHAQREDESVMSVVVRRPGGGRAAAALAERRLAELDPTLPADELAPMAGLVGDALVETRFLATVFAVFSGLALLVAIAGIYGVMASFVSSRTREIGIRVALGAEPRSLFRQVLGRGALIAAAGILAGVVPALVGARAIAGALYGASPYDPAVGLAAGVLIGLVAIAATAVPGRRAARVDPAATLRRDRV